jgi:uncharacterized membrane protein
MARQNIDMDENPGDTPRSLDFEPDERFKLERVALFSDAIFAIAATLLVIDLRLPEGTENMSEAQLIDALVSLTPRYYAFVVSFVVIGLYWAAHHLTFGRFVRYDPGLPYVNLPVLFCIAVLPFTTSVLGEHPDLTGAVVLYAGWMMVTGFASTALWVWATQRRRLLPADVSDDWIRERTWLGLSVPLAFSASIPIAFVSPLAAQIAWWPLVIVMNIAIARRFER